MTSTITHKVKSLPNKPNSRSRRSTFLKRLRDIHGWLGLWGAILGLLFGATGIIHNHRTVLKIELEKPKSSEIQMVVPDEAKSSPESMGIWLRKELSMDREPRLKKEKAETVSWDGKDVKQPEHWDVRFVAPQYKVIADYWVGSNMVKIKRTDETWVGAIDNFHRANGAGIGWVLLADSIGGSMILLSITGVLLWTELNRRKTIGAIVFVVSTIGLVIIAFKTMFA
ncbi:PepSY-associated TM helix domain-containing protein [Methylophilus luteus]|uniref:PepSY-associated TM helix domain-containing protein n=1 Tax=Methylophilus luteus TaxID=640108 RepID=A0ABW3F785_9PROT